MEYRKVQILIVEDCEESCIAFERALTQYGDMEIMDCTDSARIGEMLIREQHPDVVILDLELNEGSGMELARKIYEMDEAERPYVIVTTVITSRVTHEILHSYGVGIIFLKTLPDYNEEFVLEHVQMSVDFLLRIAHQKKPPRKKTKLDLLNSTEEEIKHEISFRLCKIGIFADMEAHDPLVDICYMVMGMRYVPDFKNQIYPVIARKYNTKPANIDRNIRSALERAWENTRLRTLEEMYPFPTNSAEGKPTPKTFVANFVKTF